MMPPVDPSLIVPAMLSAVLVLAVANWRPALGLILACGLWAIWGAIELRNRLWRPR